MPRSYALNAKVFHRENEGLPMGSEPRGSQARAMGFTAAFRKWVFEDNGPVARIVPPFNTS